MAIASRASYSGSIIVTENAILSYRSLCCTLSRSVLSVVKNSKEISMFPLPVQEVLSFAQRLHDPGDRVCSIRTLRPSYKSE